MDLQATLEGFLDEQRARLSPLGHDAVRLLNQAQLMVRGGKRLRAAFCFWGYQSVQAEVADRSALLKACAALELLHASALVHDDFMDASQVRRGNQTAHRYFAHEHRAANWTGSALEYGAAGAILLGDLLLSWADELLRRCGLPSERVTEAMGLFDLCRSEVIVGQFLDVSVQARGRADVDTAMTVLRFKSAKYSIERPLHIGAALAGGSDALQQGLGAFGLPLGEAFQLRDDLLGVFGDPAATGKPAGDDLVEGKRTVLIALALEGSDAETAAELEAALGTNLDQAGITRARHIIETSGAAEQVEAAIDALTAQAITALMRAGIEARATEVLLSLAQAATIRSS